ncbi:hypothetical protein [Arenimonas daejeonensis]|uniref:hypothetical protein n=1 Tax=Arenimonas daejeonensis TaxID=370777 RepID=UPI001D147D53|nr:hypothetical protein [Arenimonas daejeonensis]
MPSGRRCRLRGQGILDRWVGIALAWLWAVDGVRPTWTDWLGVGLCLTGATVIILGSRPH